VWEDIVLNFTPRRQSDRWLEIADSSDRHWIGMWWGGFLVCGASLVVISIPFFFFPKELKVMKSARVRDPSALNDFFPLQKEKVKVYIDEKYHHATDPSIRPKPKEGGAIVPADGQAASGVRRPSASAPVSKSASLKSGAVAPNADSDNYGKDIKDIPRSTWKLLTNKIYIVTCLGACMELIIVSGFIVFLPKYLETQFNLGKSMASMFTGGIAIPGACIGIFLGGYLLKRFQLRPLGAVQFVIFFNVTCLACYGALFFFG